MSIGNTIFGDLALEIILFGIAEKIIPRLKKLSNKATKKHIYHNCGIQGLLFHIDLPIKLVGVLYSAALVQQNANNAKKTMRQIITVGIIVKGFNRLLSVRFYIQMARAQMEYDLAVSVLNLDHLKKLESCQNEGTP
ncbi:hypothetical protein G6F60_012779 [Rhizopus arrhizus]|nr:hypothetical protein G6F61_012726 [Rhizopus arrhizus]KAG1390979.1 hypothetical protein G6F60_012779 [Rhizopus arrhizus]